MDARSEPDELLKKLLAIFHRLRGPGGCPWDAVQTHKSLVPYLHEEYTEVADAVESGDPGRLRDELGDVLLQVLFHAVIAEQEGRFTMSDVMRGLENKLIRRHPHVFGQKKARNADEVRAIWKERKEAEKPDAKNGNTALTGIPVNVDVLTRAHAIGHRAARTGFDWENPGQVVEKIREELEEVSAELDGGSPDRVEEEIGDLMFAVVNLARYLKIDSQRCLHKANEKFIRRFHAMEESIRTDGKKLDDLSLLQMEDYWRKSR